MNLVFREKMRKERVGDIISGRIVSIDSGATLVEAASMMIKENVGWILILEEGSLRGILTERDIMHQAHEIGGDLDSVKVGDVMSRDVVTIKNTATLLEAADIMEKHLFRRLPVPQPGDGKLFPIGLEVADSRLVQDLDPDPFLRLCDFDNLLQPFGGNHNDMNSSM